MFNSFRTLRQARSPTSRRFIKTLLEKRWPGYAEMYKKSPKKTPIEHLVSGFGMLLVETKKWLKEQKEHIMSNPIMYHAHNEVDTIWQFNDAASLNEWVVTCDSDHQQGFSKASLTLSSEGKGVFSGTLSTRLPKDGIIRRAGFCNVRAVPYTMSFFRTRPRNWNGYNFIFLRVRGDGRPYLINIGNSGFFDPIDDDLYTYVMYTRGGPHWQDVKIPFSKFVLGSRGKIQDRQGPLDLGLVSNFNITLADTVNGPFKLEIDHIGLGNDWSHHEKTAYEIYKY